MPVDDVKGGNGDGQKTLMGLIIDGGLYPKLVGVGATNNSHIN